MEFTPVQSRKWGVGWSAEKQGHFIRHLAATGSVSQSAAHVGMSVRSAYYLRTRADAGAFADAWDRALRLAAGQLMAIAYERAIEGGRRKWYKDGELVAEYAAPSDRVLLWLLGRIDPKWAANEYNPLEQRVSGPTKLVHSVALLKDMPATDLDHAEAAAREAAEERAAEPAPALAPPQAPLWPDREVCEVSRPDRDCPLKNQKQKQGRAGQARLVGLRRPPAPANGGGLRRVRR